MSEQQALTEQRVKIKVRVNQQVPFPAICVHCAQPATAAEEKMEIRRRIGRAARMIEVPLCAECCRHLRRQSGEEERLQKLSKLLVILTFLLVLPLVLLFTPASMNLAVRVLSAASAAFVLSQIADTYLRRARRKAALPEKQAITSSAAIVDFSWRATTFEFTNQAFCERFRILNEPRLMEI